MIKINVPGSKSITNRVLLVAALAKGKTRISGALESDDTRHMQRSLTAIGVRIKKSGKNIIVSGGKLKKPRVPLFCGNAGTAMRFLAAVAATQPFETTLDGDARMRERPIKDLLDALEQLGARTICLKKNTFPPIKITGPLRGGECRLRGNVSSQFLSGLLMAAPLAQNDVTIKIEGDLVSKPYVDLTLDVMRHFGVPIHRYGYRKFKIKAGQHYRRQKYEIEGDASSASYFWGIGTLTGEETKVTNVPKNSQQADVAFLRTIPLLRRRGALRLNCSDFPDSAMTLAVLCAFRKGKTTLTGLANLRVKESDRLRGLATELRKIGAKVQELQDGLTIKGDPEKLHGARIKTYNDHRMAMCFGMAGVVLPGIKIENPGCVKKTYPNFWKDLAKIKKRLCEKNIVLTGMRGSGKTSIGRALAKKLKRKFIDLDAVIAVHARRPISEIVAAHGWEYFRVLEQKAVARMKNTKHAVIATGGGTIMFSKNVKILKKNGKVIFLESSINSLAKRLTGKPDRPALGGAKDFIAELEEVYRKRKKRYREVADAVIEVSKQSGDERKDVMEKAVKILKVATRWGMR